MEIETLCAQLEEHFELEELMMLSERLLGFSPDEVGGTTKISSFARALTTHCVEHQAIEALRDAVIAKKPAASERFSSLNSETLGAKDLNAGDRFGPFTIFQTLGKGPTGSSYRVQFEDRDIRLKVLRAACSGAPRGLQRFLTFSRMCKDLSGSGTPTNLNVGSVDGRYYTVADYFEGPTLKELVASGGPLHLNDAAAVIRQLLEALHEYHLAGLTHGNLKPSNVLVRRRDHGGADVVLLDAGTDRLEVRAPDNGKVDVLRVAAPETAAPELWGGEPSSAASDVYATGVLIYYLLTGKLPAEGQTALGLALAHLTEVPELPSSAAPEGWINEALDEFVLRLLSRDKSERPEDADTALDAFEHLMMARSQRPPASDELLEERIEKLLADPTNAGLALALEALTEDGQNGVSVAETFMCAFESLTEEPGHLQARLNLAFRAGRLFRQAGEKERAEEVYGKLVELEPTNRVATTALEDLRRQLQKYDELVEGWLVQSDSLKSPAERAEAMAKIAALYEAELADPAQSLVAFTQAFCLAPEKVEYARAVERLAKNDQAAWTEVLAACTESVPNHAVEDSVRLLLQMGRWYADKQSRYDLALQVYQSILNNDAANEPAMLGITHIYRRAQQWPELAEALKRHASLAKTPTHARDLKAEAADILAGKLAEPDRARQLLEEVLDEDPSHKAASDGLAQLYEASQDFKSYVKLLKQRAASVRGTERSALLCRIGEIQEDRLGDVQTAVETYLEVLREEPTSLAALRGLDRCYTKLGSYGELLTNLLEQERLAATPRQRLTLKGRIAALYEEEFIDPNRAAESYREMLDIDGKHDAALTALARIYTGQKRWRDAIEIYDAHVDASGAPNRKGALLLAKARILDKQLHAPDLAVSTYEAVLEHMPDQGEALSALAQLRANAGDADEALRAIEALAQGSHDAHVKAESYIKAAKLLEDRGDMMGAIDRYRLALQSEPDHSAAADGLYDALLIRNDVQGAAELLVTGIEQARLASRRAILSARLARLALERLEDVELAQNAAAQALQADASCAPALFVMSEVHRRSGDTAQAAQCLAPVMNLLDQMGDDALTAVFGYIDLLAELGSTEAALQHIETVRNLAPDDVGVLKRIADIAFEHGDPALARNLYTDLLDRFEDDLSDDERFIASYRRGEATLRAGHTDMAVMLLEEASDLNPSSPLPLAALAEGYTRREQWSRVFEIKSRLLDMLEGDERVNALVELGELANDQLGDKDLALKSFVAALDERPDDRKLLARLMELYSAEKDWTHLVEVVVKLAEFQEDPGQRAKYLMTAGMLSTRELGEFDFALDCFAQVMALDGSQEKAFEESLTIHRNRGDHASQEKLLKTRMKAASAAKDSKTLLRMFDALGDLYTDLNRVDDAVDALEAAHTLDPDNRARLDKLAALYSSDSHRFFDKARSLQEKLLRADPYRAEAYKALRKLYTEAKNADGAWCLCQALFVLNLAGPDEERFFTRMRATDPAYAQSVFGDDDWALLTHPDLDPYLTSIFALIEPAVIEGRGQALESLGYNPYAAMDLANHHLPVAQTLFYAAGVMNLEPPHCFENPNDPGGLQFLPANPPSSSIGTGLTMGNVEPQPLAFLAAQHLAYYRPGFLMRQLVATGTGLKSWLFAAIKLMSPQFPVAADVEGSVQESLLVLRERMSQPAKDELARAVSKLLQSATALDLKKWVSAVDLSTDRVGFVLAHDLETAMEVIRASDEGNADRAQRRLKELVLFAISQPYLTLRARLQIDLQT